MKRLASKLKEGNHQSQLEWVDEIVAELRAGDVEAKERGDQETKDRRAAKERIDPNQQSCGDTPGKPLGRCAHPQQFNDGIHQAAMQAFANARWLASVDFFEALFVL